MNLSDLKPGQTGIVDQIVNGKHGQALVERLEAMGIVADRPVQVLRKSKLGGPLQIRVGGSTTEIAIAPQEAEMILIKKDILSEDSEIIPDSSIELTKQFTTASLVSITAIILVFIAGIYRIVINRKINPVNTEIVAKNIVDNSSAKLALDKTTKTVPAVAKNADSGNKKSSSLEQGIIAIDQKSITNQNTSRYVAAKTNSNYQNRDSKAEKISDTKQLRELKQKLYNTIDQSWKNPINITSIYLVKVDKNGTITSYQPLNQVASNNINNTPLPNLVNSDSTTTKAAKTEWAEFAVLFYDNGTLEVQFNN